MTAEIAYKLLAIFATIGLGWLAGARGWLGGGRASGGGAERAGEPDPGTARAAQVLSDLAFTLFVPALLFRTVVRQDFAQMPWPTLAAYFAPAAAFLLAVYAWHRLRNRGAPPAAAATATVTATYGNAVQLGIPLSAALYGEVGLALHIALVTVHGLLLLTLATVLAETDLARASGAPSRWTTVKTTVRNAVWHPVTLPVLAGCAWNLSGIGLHPAADQALAVLATAVTPVCLVLIGLNLALYGLRGRLQGAAGVSLLKLAVLPALVLAVAHGLMGIEGAALGVLVMMGALPTGSNALIFAQRYRVLQAEATAAIVVSTAAFALAAAAWLVVLGWLSG